MLSDREIAAAIKAGELVIKPLNPKSIQPASVDVHLGDRVSFYRFGVGEQDGRRRYVDPLAVPDDLMTTVDITPDGWTLKPGEFVLGSTTEHITLSPGLAARFEGKSSLGRLGLLTHVTAGFIDPGFSGQITVELYNLFPAKIKLTAGMPIGQLCVSRPSSPAARPYGTPGLGSRYQGQRGPTGSRGVGRREEAS